jgi:hypothetical protein
VITVEMLASRYRLSFTASKCRHWIGEQASVKTGARPLVVNRVLMAIPITRLGEVRFYAFILGAGERYSGSYATFPTFNLGERNRRSRV